jgi:hypothetical protein
MIDDERQQYDVTVDHSGLKKGEKLIVRRDSQGRVREIEKTDSCWVATAYFGSPVHPEVQKLRVFRNNLIILPRFGYLFLGLNNIYHMIGRTGFGKWWAKGVRNTSKHTFRRTTSRLTLALIAKLSP